MVQAQNSNESIVYNNHQIKMFSGVINVERKLTPWQNLANELTCNASCDATFR